MNLSIDSEFKDLLSDQITMSFDAYYLGFVYPYIRGRVNLEELLDNIRNWIDQYYNQEIDLRIKIEMLIDEFIKDVPEVIKFEQNRDQKEGYNEYFTQISKLILKYNDLTKEILFYIGQFHALYPSINIQRHMESIFNNCKSNDEKNYLDKTLVYLNSIPRNKNNESKILRIPKSESEIKLDRRSVKVENIVKCEDQAKTLVPGPVSGKVKLEEDSIYKQRIADLNTRQNTMHVDPMPNNSGNPNNSIQGKANTTIPSNDILANNSPWAVRNTHFGGLPKPFNQPQHQLNESLNIKEEMDTQGMTEYKRPEINNSTQNQAFPRQPPIDGIESGQPQGQSFDNYASASNKNSSLNHPDLQAIRCCICQDRIITDKSYKLAQCGDHIHNACIINYLIDNINKGTIPIVCPKNKCPAEFHLSDLVELLDVKYCEEFFKLTLKLFLEKDGTINSCATPGCSYFYVREVNDKHFECPKCKKNYCMSCHTDRDSSHECHKIKKEAVDSTDNKWNSQYSLKCKKCPKCGKWVAKKPLVDRLDCGCEHRFCFYCGYACEGLMCQCFKNKTFFPSVPKEVFHRYQLADFAYNNVFRIVKTPTHYLKALVSLAQKDSERDRTINRNTHQAQVSANTTLYKNRDEMTKY